MNIFGERDSKLKVTSPIIHKISEEILQGLSPFEIFSTIQDQTDYCFILDSVVGSDKLAEYSFIGFDPDLKIQVKDHCMKVIDINGDKLEESRIEEPLDEIRKLIGTTRINNNISRFMGGAVGYISYDAIRYWENIPNRTVPNLDYPDIDMAIYRDGLIFDHKLRNVFYFHTGKNRLDMVQELIKKKHAYSSSSYSEPKTNTTRDNYEDSILTAKEYIASGDIFQIVLSRRIDFKIDGELTSFYKNLMEINPSPYMYFLKMGKRNIIGSSPEMLVRVDNRKVETFPIAGTRPRVDDKVANNRLTEELLADPKDRAEHLMLVDLARNDIGRISNYATVKVPEFMNVHQYSHVQHIVSRVVGELAEGYDSFDTLKAVFPAGTVSGAPKVRAMEIIDELETSRRGPYAGAIGYFSFNGNSDHAITIRTLTVDSGSASIQVGAGIVADSVPENEWLETEQKVEGLFKALERSSSE